MGTFATIFEIVMVLCFGASWPFNIVRAYKARTTKGTSLQFTILIGIGYIGGILSKIFASADQGAGYWKPLTVLAFVFYIINLCMILTALAIYFRNKKLDAARAAAGKAEKAE
ncbi:MAG TPA: hypothetical protein IAB32_03120 [Candidatus Scatosoma pullicola]|nr:hypothetical protein [Candidatus Scatosoma pullicola]